jgi:hypothetical protein
VPEEENEAATLSEDLVERRMQRFQPRSSSYPIKYKSIYKVHQRVAKDFRVRRVLLAGDAAHLNNPIGAFGLNGGIHDAFNLADKLGRVCRGEADQSLLDRYVRQRRTVNLEYVQEVSIRNLKRLSEKSEPERRKNFDELRRQASTRESQREFLLVSSMIASVRRAMQLPSGKCGSDSASRGGAGAPVPGDAPRPRSPERWCGTGREAAATHTLPLAGVARCSRTLLRTPSRSGTPAARWRPTR